VKACSGDESKSCRAVRSLLIKGANRFVKTYEFTDENGKTKAPKLPVDMIDKDCEDD